jgi:hypothetical protein
MLFCFGILVYYNIVISTSIINEMGDNKRKLTAKEILQNLFLVRLD